MFAHLVVARHYKTFAKSLCIMGGYCNAGWAHKENQLEFVPQVAMSVYTWQLSNVGSDISHLMEQCLGYLEFLLYLDDICVFTSIIEDMLDSTELLFKRL